LFNYNHLYCSQASFITIINIVRTLLEVFTCATLASAVLAIERYGWLVGWLAGCPSHNDIVSKRLNLS